MNVNTHIRPDSAVAAATRPHSVPERADRSAQERPAHLGTVDTVEISGTARLAAEIHANTEKLIEEANRDFKANHKARTKAAAPYTEEDLAPLKARFSKLLDNERSIYGRIASLMSKPGTQRGALDQLKVEIDSKGNAVVGGITDVKAARALEKAINSDKKLLSDIIEYQGEEKLISDEMREVTGMSLKAYANRIDSAQRNNNKNERIFFDLDNGEFSSSPESAIALRDQELYAVDSEFAAMISERYAAGSAAMDISGQNNILGSSGFFGDGRVREGFSSISHSLDLCCPKDGFVYVEHASESGLRAS